MNKPVIRSEQPADVDTIGDVHRAAFPTDAEARLVAALRSTGNLSISLVAELDGKVVGHIAFSPVQIAGCATSQLGLGLAPVAVLPASQRHGVGSALCNAGLEECRRRGCGYAVVLGHRDYYPRFGFRRASPRKLQNEYGADESFMVIEFVDGCLPADGGLVQYGPEFAIFAE